MRLWSIHPKYLDSKGLVALWREGLLAQSVLQGDTKGYTHHPQLIRFKDTTNPVGAIAGYLQGIAHEADNRGYKFTKTKIANRRFRGKISVTIGQLNYERQHLLRKLENRNFELYVQLKKIEDVVPHPLFRVVDGDVEVWEVV